MPAPSTGAAAAERLRASIAACTVCRPHCPEGCRPLVQFHPAARILVIGQAPGARAHRSGIPWSDPSGDRLRSWLGVDAPCFYDPRMVALMPMGFCYPGTGRSGDLPPRPECAPLWHRRILDLLPDIRVTILLGRYAIDRYGGAAAGMDLAGAARNDRQGPWILPHPSPRNQAWLRRHPWLEAEVLPRLRMAVARAVRDGTGG